MISDEDQFLSIPTECSKDVRLQHFASFFDHDDIRSCGVNGIPENCRSRCRTSDNPLRTENQSGPLLEFVADGSLVDVARISGLENSFDLSLEYLVVPLFLH